jgi:hypothetical protein
MLFCVVDRKKMRKRQEVDEMIVASMIIKAFASSALGSPRMESIYLMMPQIDMLQIVVRYRKIIVTNEWLKGLEDVGVSIPSFQKHKRQTNF